MGTFTLIKNVLEGEESVQLGCVDLCSYYAGIQYGCQFLMSKGVLTGGEADALAEKRFVQAMLKCSGDPLSEYYDV